MPAGPSVSTTLASTGLGNCHAPYAAESRRNYSFQTILRKPTSDRATISPSASCRCEVQSRPRGVECLSCARRAEHQCLLLRTSSVALADPRPGHWGKWGSAKRTYTAPHPRGFMARCRRGPGSGSLPGTPIRSRLGLVASSAFPP